MDPRDIDKEVSRLVMEKHLLTLSMNRTTNEEEKKEIKYIMQKKYKPSVMKHEKEFFPEEYKNLVKICPYLKLED